jgi:hypothetical protein
MLRNTNFIENIDQELEIMLKYEEKKLKLLSTQSIKTKFENLINLRSRLNFFGVFQIFDRLDHIDNEIDKEN